MRSLFYARVSNTDQSLERQLEAAREVGIAEEYIFVDKASGKDFQRPEYQLMKRMFREGDALYAKYLDRLGRNKQMILDEWQDLVKNKQFDHCCVVYASVEHNEIERAGRAGNTNL